VVASAAENGRALSTPDDASQAILITVLGVGAAFLVATLGRLYQLRRGLHWRFQDPDDADHGAGH
jgi:hypothetical protein